MNISNMRNKIRQRLALVLFVFSMLLLPPAFPITSFLTPHIDTFMTGTVPPQCPDAPSFAEHPHNITLEFGERLGVQLNLTEGGAAAAWAVSDAVHFRIGGGWGSTSALVKDTMVLPIGEYFLRVTVFDEQYARASITFWVFVVDSHFPSIGGPGQIEFTEGTDRTRSFRWEVSDANPVSYLITLNDALLQQGEWTEEQTEFEISIGHLRTGTYIYEITLTDLGNNIMSNKVTVKVVSDGTDDHLAIARDYVPNSVEQNAYVDSPDILFIEVFAIVVLSGLVGLVMMSAVAGTRSEFGFD